MKQPLSPGAVAGVIAAVVLVIGGAAFMWWRGNDAAPIDKEREKMEAQNAKNYYKQYTDQGKGATPSAPSGGTSTEADARSKMQSGGG